MKRFLSVFLILLLVSHTQAAHILFNLKDFVQNPLVVKQVKLSPNDKPGVNNTNIITRDTVTKQTSTGGQVTFSNVVAGNYQVDVSGPTLLTTFQITVTNTTELINAKDITSTSTNAPNAVHAYSMDSSDGRYMRQATNPPGVDGQVLFSDGTIQPYWGDAPAGGSGVVSNFTARTLWVATNGNDGTALRGRQDKPFLTLSAAKAAAFAGDLIWTRPGFYLATNVLKNGVYYWLDANAIWTNTPVATVPVSHDMMNDQGGATTNIIGGFGEYHYLMETNTPPFFSRGAIVLTNPASRLLVTGSRMLGRQFLTIDNAAVQIDDCAYFSLTLDEYLDPDIYRTSFDPADPETEIFSDCTFVNWLNGEVEIKVNRATTENGYVLWSHGKTNTLNWSGSRMVSQRGNALYVSSSNNNQRTWVKLTELLEGGGQAISGVDKGGGRLYVSIPKVRGGAVAPAPVISIVGHEYWMNFQKLSSAFAGDPSGAAGAFIDVISGKAFIEVQEYDAESQLVGPAITVKGGTNTFIGGTLLATNGIGIKLSGPHKTRLKEMAISTFSTSGTGNTNEPVLSITNNLTLQNCSLNAPSASVNSIKSTNTINPIAVEGVLYLNSAPGSSVVFNSGIEIAGTNMLLRLSAPIDDQVLTFVNGYWTNKTVSGVGATAWDAIGDPSGDGTIAFGATQQTITSTRDSASDPGVMVLQNSDTSLANDTSLLDLKHASNTDAQGIYARFISDYLAAPIEDFKFSESVFNVGVGITTTFSGPTAVPTATTGDADTTAASTDFVRNTLVTSNFVTVAGNQTITGDKTHTGTLQINDVFQRTPAKTIDGVMTVTGTNSWTFNSATNFNFSFSGTPVNGQRVALTVSNYNVTASIFGTNAAGIYSSFARSNINIFEFGSNNIETLEFEYQTNFVATGFWKINQWSARDFELEPGSNITFTTNGATGKITIASSAAGGGDAVLINATAVSDSVSFTNTAASATVAPTTWSVTAGTDPDPDKATVAIGAANATDAGIVTANEQRYGGLKLFDGGISNALWLTVSGNVTNRGIVTNAGAVYNGSHVTTHGAVTNNSTVTNVGVVNNGGAVTNHGSTKLIGAVTSDTSISNVWYRGTGAITNTADAYLQTVNMTAATITNNITFVTTNMIPTGNATNFAGTFNNAWVTYTMTNAYRLTGMVDVAAANLAKPWICKLRNTNGAAYRVSVDAGFRRSGTNDVSVGNNQNCDVIVAPDGTGGVNPTNMTVQIILYDSP